MLKIEVNGEAQTCSLGIKGETREILLEMCGAIESIIFAVYRTHADDPNLMHDGAAVATAAALAVRNGISRVKKEAHHEA